MALRSLATQPLALVLICLVLAWASPAIACFGPKLYIGVATDARQELLYAAAALYVQEKTGVESELVRLAAGDEPMAALRGERVDLVFTATAPAGMESLLAVPGYPVLVSGPRPLTDLQFTTVLPALRKLAGLLTSREMFELESRVAAGETPTAASRRLFMEKRWL